MAPIAQYLLAALLFVLGLAAIGGATFGRKRNLRLLLAVLGVLLWLACLALYSQVTSQPDTAQPLPTAVDVVTPTSEPPPLRVAFHSRRTDDLEIWGTSADGSELRRLTTAPGRDIEPDWSPDGSLLAFSSARDDPSNVQIYVMEIDGGSPQRLMDFIPADQLSPRWSPDGEWVMFYTNADGRLEIYKVRKDGSELTNVSNHPGNNFMGDWSPDGSRIIFTSERDFNRELYVMNADGSNQVRLTENNAEDWRPRWSPDGATILFESNRSGRRSLYLMDAPDGATTGPGLAVRQLSAPEFSDIMPAWADQGRQILFSSDRHAPGTSSWDVYIMDVNGGNVVRLTDDPEIDRSPAWRP